MAPQPDLKSRFMSFLLENNRPQMDGFKNWLFHPGMLFNSRETWWGAEKQRAAPHEGLDLCSFEDTNGLVKKVDNRIKIPATFAGAIVKIHQDFLGKSIYLSHEIFAADGSRLYTIYGHTKPLSSLAPGDRVAEGEILGAVSAASGQKSPVPAHLHISFAWVPGSLDPKRLTWKNLGLDRRITLINPLSVLAIAKQEP